MAYVARLVELKCRAWGSPLGQILESFFELEECQHQAIEANTNVCVFASIGHAARVPFNPVQVLVLSLQPCEAYALTSVSDRFS